MEFLGSLHVDPILSSCRSHYFLWISHALFIQISCSFYVVLILTSCPSHDLFMYISCSLLIFGFLLSSCRSNALFVSILWTLYRYHDRFLQLFNYLHIDQCSLYHIDLIIFFCRPHALFLSIFFTLSCISHALPCRSHVLFI